MRSALTSPRLVLQVFEPPELEGPELQGPELHEPALHEPALHEPAFHELALHGPAWVLAAARLPKLFR
jgi:hypothetical protein